MSRTLVLTLSTLSLLSATAHAELELPRPSPNAKVMLTVGLTDVTVDYSSPAVKARKIWGGLVPYGKLWRTGANQATKITFSKDVIVGDKPIPAGTYGLYTIPTATTWTVGLSKAYNHGGQTYQPADDVARFEVKPKLAPMRERMTFLFSDYNENTASLDLEWEKLRVSIPIKAKTEEQVAAGIKNMTEGAWRPYAMAARYLLEQKKDTDQALELVDKSIAIKEEWLNVWVKAALLAQKGKYKEAYPLAEKAQALGVKSEQFFLATDVKKALTDWKGK
jgi:hypothetical protein